MRRFMLCGLLVLLPSSLFAQPSARESTDARAIRDCISTYVEAFNRGDAAAIAQLWSPSGVWVSPDGARLSGRDAIEEAMSTYFADSPERVLSLLGTSIRLVAPTVAIEEGRARVVETGAAPIESTYIAIHVKHEDGWQLDSVRETAVAAPPSNYEFLKPLEWMIGTWVDRDGQTELETTCEWTKNKNFMTRSFRAKMDGETVLEGTQVIGYDAVNKSIRSWVFDTEGGIGEGTWQHDGKRWMVKSTHHQASGQLGSSINILTPVDENSFLWQSTGRELDGEILPDISPVTVVRQ
jgi:uncharacterized protein (TIGR02246 family)